MFKSPRVPVVPWFMSKDSVRFVAKLHVELCPRTGIHAYLRARAMSREILWQEPWNSHKQLYIRTNFQTKWLVQSIKVIEKVKNWMYLYLLINITNSEIRNSLKNNILSLVSNLVPSVHWKVGGLVKPLAEQTRLALPPSCTSTVAVTGSSSEGGV